jgi:hypothetical protein
MSPSESYWWCMGCPCSELVTSFGRARSIYVSWEDVRNTHVIWCGPYGLSLLFTWCIYMQSWWCLHWTWCLMRERYLGR